MTYEDYCTYEQSIKLKELGFDWIYGEGFQEKTYYNNLKTLCQFDEEIVTTEVPAPTLAQAQKWIREVKGVVLVVQFGRGKYWWDIFYSNKNIYAPLDYDTYEQSLSAGIDKALELLKERENAR